MAQLEQLWKEWKSEGSRKAKDRLLAEYAGLVRQTAQRMAVGLPSHVEMGDLVGSGVMGLIRAVETFEPEREVKFETYAAHKIRGAILDELRSLDWVPRSVRQKGRNLQKAYSTLSSTLGRTPYDDEVAQHLGLTLVEFEELLTEVAPLTVISLDEQDGLGADAPDLSETIADPQATNALAELEEGQLKSILTEAITGLPPKERLVVAMYHFEELNFKEVGKVMGITESRVCQIHSKAMVKLRSRVRLQARK